MVPRFNPPPGLAAAGLPGAPIRGRLSIPRIISPAGIILASLLAARAVAAQAIEKPRSAAPDKETISVAMNGEYVPTFGRPRVSLEPISARFTVFMWPASPSRRLFRLEGVDDSWQSGLCKASSDIVFLDEHGEQVTQESEELFGESPGWNGSLEKPVFATKKKTLIAPPGARSFWFIISSAGPPETLGTILVKGVTITRMRQDGPSEVIMRAPMGKDTGASPVQPAPSGFTADGIRPRMAKLLTLPSSAGSEECFAIIDDDTQAHAEWRTVKESAPKVVEGDRLEMEWQEAFSVSGGLVTVREYDRPPPGTYRLRVRPVDLLGRPDGAETSLAITILGPWWKRGWFWALVALAAAGGAFAVTRYLVLQQMRRQLERLHEERLIEQERMRIAREIHDTLAQGFTGIIVQLEAAEDAQTQGLKKENVDHLRRASDLARDSLQEARRSVFALRPQALEQRELADALTELIAKMTAGTALQGELLVDGTPRKLPDEVEQNLLRIGQEALTNALRHARASRFTATLTFRSETVLLDLKDDGRGFDVASRNEGFGLTGMKERVESMAGRLQIASAPGEGTTISLVLPVKEPPVRAP
jgi:signal transduction histidine kinase